MKLDPSTETTFGFKAPMDPGSYAVSVQAWWPNDLGGGSQQFVIDVRI
jgi:hypothetical protein